jgi:hypothetical protein
MAQIPCTGESSNPPVTCENGGYAALPPPEQQQKQISEALNALGADAKCKRDFQSRYSSGNFEASASAMFGLLRAGASGGFQENSMSNSSEGCGALDMTMSQMLSSHNNMNCAINKTENLSCNSVTAGARVTVKPFPVSEEEKARIDKNIERLTTATSNLGLNPNEYSVKLAEMNLKTIESLNKSKGYLKMKNSTLKASGSLVMKSITTTTDSTMQTLQTESKKMTSAAAEYDITKKLGVGASVDENTKRVIDNKVEEYSNTINTSIREAVTRSQVDVKNDSTVEIIVPQFAILEGLTLSADTQVDLVLSSLSTSSVELGQQIANEVVTETMTKTKSQLEADGQEDLAKALGDYITNANAATVAARESGGLSQMDLGSVAAIVGGIAAVAIVLGIVAMMMKKDDSRERYPPPPPPQPPPPMEDDFKPVGMEENVQYMK